MSACYFVSKGNIIGDNIKHNTIDKVRNSTYLNHISET